MATDYISRAELYAAFCKASAPAFDNHGKATFIVDYVKVLETIPATDVRPAVRGKWLTGNDNPRTYGRIRAMCGRCGAFALAEMVNAGSYKERLSNFCPNCGADMREES